MGNILRGYILLLLNSIKGIPCFFPGVAAAGSYPAAAGSYAGQPAAAAAASAAAAAAAAAGQQPQQPQPPFADVMQHAAAAHAHLSLQGYAIPAAATTADLMSPPARAPSTGSSVSGQLDTVIPNGAQPVAVPPPQPVVPQPPMVVQTNQVRLLTSLQHTSKPGYAV